MRSADTFCVNGIESPRHRRDIGWTHPGDSPAREVKAPHSRCTPVSKEQVGAKLRLPTAGCTRCLRFAETDAQLVACSRKSGRLIPQGFSIRVGTVAAAHPPSPTGKKDQDRTGGTPCWSGRAVPPAACGSLKTDSRCNNFCSLFPDHARRAWIRLLCISLLSTSPTSVACIRFGPALPCAPNPPTCADIFPTPPNSVPRLPSGHFATSETTPTELTPKTTPGASTS